MIFDKLPKSVALAILLVKALDLKEAIKVTQQILYLWREFMVKISIKPRIESYKISFYWKDKYLNSTEIKELKDVVKIIEDLKLERTKE